MSVHSNVCRLRLAGFSRRRQALETDCTVLNHQTCSVAESTIMTRRIKTILVLGDSPENVQETQILCQRPTFVLMLKCERDVGEYVSFVPCVSMIVVSE